MALYIAMATFALVTSLSPGPVNILATISGANHGYIRTTPHILGATIGFVSILLLIGFGLIRVLDESHQLTQILSYIGAIFLLYLAFKVATSEIIPNEENGKGKVPSLLDGMMCQWLNPKAWIVSLSGVTMFSNNGDIQQHYLILFSIIFFVICFLCISMWAILGLTISKYLAHPIYYKWFNRLMGLTLAFTVVSVFFL
ncbi:TPA: LysE family translocator [Yersinia enterocolitica]